MALTETIQAVLISIEVAGKRCLFVLLAKDGSINRMGSGSPSTEDGHLFIGKTEEPLFLRFMAEVTDDLLSHPGLYSSPGEHLGEPCQLDILFQTLEGETIALGFTYGSQSQGPPSEIGNLAIKAVQLTDPWHQEFKRNAQTPKRGWWPFRR